MLFSGYLIMNGMYIACGKSKLMGMYVSVITPFSRGEFFSKAGNMKCSGFYGDMRFGSNNSICDILILCNISTYCDRSTY